MMMVMSALANGDLKLSAGSPRIGTGVKILTKTSNFILSAPADSPKWRRTTESKNLVELSNDAQRHIFG